MTDKTAAAVMAALLVGRLMGIGHQNIESGTARIIASGGADGAAANNDKIVLHGEFRVIALLAG